MGSTHYETLGVPEDASAQEITAAWRILMRKNHPDVAGADGAERSALVNAAYTVLGDENARVLYNADLRRTREREQPRPQASGYRQSAPYEGDPFVDPGVSYAETPAEDIDEEPLRFTDFTDHPVTRRNLYLGAAGLVLFLTGGALVALTISGLVRIALLGAAVLLIVSIVIPFLRQVTIVPVAIGIIAAGVYGYLAQSPMAVAAAVALVLSFYPLRRGVQVLLSIRAQIAEDKRDIAQRRHAEKMERKRQAQAEEAARRRAARTAKREEKRSRRRE